MKATAWSVTMGTPVLPVRICDPVELVDVPAALEAELADHRHRRRLLQDGDGEPPARLDALVGVVLLVDADRHGGRLRGDLKDRVGDLAVEFSLLAGGDHVEAVAQFVKRRFVHRLFSLSNDPGVRFPFLSPKIPRPIRTIVAPSSTATA